MRYKDNSKPLMLFVAEEIYKKVSGIKKNNLDITNVEAIEIFMGTNDFRDISSGKFHKELYLELKRNNFINKDTGKQYPDESIKLLEIQKKTVMERFNLPNGEYFPKSSYPLSNFQSAFDLLYRMCESYELWCQETGNKKLIILDMIENL